MTDSTEQIEFIAPPPVALLGNIEKLKRLNVRRLDTGEELTIKGRAAWCLAQLLTTGDKGVTPIERPAPRWSDYVHRLRRRGLPVQTIDETHGGTYRGTHARYVLNLPVAILEQEFAL